MYFYLIFFKVGAAGEGSFEVLGMGGRSEGIWVHESWWARDQ